MRVRFFWLVVLAIAYAQPVQRSRADEADDTALRQACFNLDIQAVQQALESKANPNSVSSDKLPQTPISQTLIGLLASRAPDVEQRGLSILKLLISNGAKIGPFDRDGFFFPVANGYNDVVLFLLKHGASPSRKLEGYSPAKLAVKYRQQATYALLIKNGASRVDEQAIKQLVLTGAATNMKPDDVVAVVKEGAMANAPDTSGLTPLVAALQMPVYWPTQVQIIEWLIDQGANVNQTSHQREGTDVDSEMPLDLFVAMNASTMNGEKEDVRDQAEEVMNYLLKAGAKVSGKDDFGATPLHEAARTNNMRAAQILIDQGAKVMAKDNEGKTPLDYAEDGSMIKLLKSRGATE